MKNQELSELKKEYFEKRRSATIRFVILGLFVPLVAIWANFAVQSPSDASANPTLARNPISDFAPFVKRDIDRAPSEENEPRLFAGGSIRVW